MSRKPRAIHRERDGTVQISGQWIRRGVWCQRIWIGKYPYTVKQARRLHKWLAAAIEWMEEKEKSGDDQRLQGEG